MIRFVAGHFAVFAGIYLWASLSDGSLVLPALNPWLDLLIALCVGPSFGAWMAAVLIHHVSPRAIFHRADSGAGPIILGLVSAAASVGLTAGLLVVGPYAINDALLLTFVAAGTAAVLLPVFTRRQRPGLCGGCGYDIRYSLCSGRCPECGRRLLA